MRARRSGLGACAPPWPACFRPDGGAGGLHLSGQPAHLGHFIAMTLGQQRMLKTVRLKRGEYMAGTKAGLAPEVAG